MRFVRSVQRVKGQRSRSEAEMCSVLEEMCGRHFEIEPQVVGRWVHHPHGYDMTSHPKIDYIFNARQHLVKQENYPAALHRFGVEAKREGARFGPAFAQALDYRLLADYGLDIVFVYPYDTGGGELASVTAQTRVGRINLVEYRERTTADMLAPWNEIEATGPLHRMLDFCVGQNTVLTVHQPEGGHSKVGRARPIHLQHAEHGRRVGSR